MNYENAQADKAINRGAAALFIYFALALIAAIIRITFIDEFNADTAQPILIHTLLILGALTCTTIGYCAAQATPQKEKHGAHLIAHAALVILKMTIIASLYPLYLLAIWDSPKS